MTADVRILIEKKPKVLVLPIEAVVTEKGKSLVHRLVARAGAGRARSTHQRARSWLWARATIARWRSPAGVNEGAEVMIKPPKRRNERLAGAIERRLTVIRMMFFEFLRVGLDGHRHAQVPLGADRCCRSPSAPSRSC